jgi:hypothetical protein
MSPSHWDLAVSPDLVDHPMEKKVVALGVVAACLLSRGTKKGLSSFYAVR